MLKILGSRKFWFALITLIVVVLTTFLPSFDINTEEATGFIFLAVTLMIGVAVDPTPGVAKWGALVRDYKFWAAVVGFVFLALKGFGIMLIFSADQVTQVLVIIGGYIASVALKDNIRYLRAGMRK
jgi:hypothetical protein